MGKITIISALALMGLTLMACIQDGEDITESFRVKTVCLDGVEYWLMDSSSQSQALAPKIDPVTLSFVRCK